MEKNFATIILASGFSERMGEPKALLKWDETTTFLEKIINEYTKAGCKRIICMINHITEPLCRDLKIPSNVTFVINEHPEWGRFYSLRLASMAAKERDFCFIQNVDNPFVTVEVIEKLYAQRNPDAWCSPVYEQKGGHPVLLPQVVIEKIAQIKENDFTLRDILKHYQKIEVEIDTETILRNINTPEEYSSYFENQS